MRPCFVRLAVRSAVAISMSLGALTAAHGQVVLPRTVPIHQNEQFAIVPSTRAAMGGVTIALDDSLADPFTNPARASMIRRDVTFAAPFNHNISGGHGGGRTLPVGAMLTKGDWAAAFVAAVQDLDHQANSNPLNVGWLNRYGQLSVARRLPRDWSVGASAYVARLNAMDEFDVLYDGSNAVSQLGTLTDFRIGATKQWSDRRLELLVVSDRTNITHDVAYEYYIRPHRYPQFVYQVDQNFDRTAVTGVQAKFVQSLGDGWRFGWLATANHLSHPKIPDYDVRNTAFVRMDPGVTNAFDFGIGVGRTIGLTTYGLDFIQEPMSSRTWGEDDAGAHTVDNRFKFSNSRVRLGAGRDVNLTPSGAVLFGVLMGLDVYTISYDLDQSDHVAGTTREAHEFWTEWTPTLGLHLRVKGADLRYTYHVTCSRHCFIPDDKVNIVQPSVGIVAAPLGAVNVDGGTPRVHQVTVTIPMS